MKKIDFGCVSFVQSTPVLFPVHKNAENKNKNCELWIVIWLPHIAKSCVTVWLVCWMATNAWLDKLPKGATPHQCQHILREGFQSSPA